MDKQRAEEILGKDAILINKIDSFFQKEKIYDGKYLLYPLDYAKDKICLEGDFTAEELEAIVWVMRNNTLGDNNVIK